MYLDQITNDELADVGRLTEMAIRAGMTVMKTVSQYRERQILQLTSELKDYRLANPLLPKGDISDLSYFWASDSLSRQVVQEMPEQAREKMKAMLTQLERQGIVLAGPDGWTLMEPGRKMVYDKYFVQNALKADIEYANQVQQTVQKVTGPATKETAIWRNVGEELRQIGKDAANSPKDAIQRLQNINRALKHDSKLNGSSLQKAITHAMREIVVEGKPVTGTIDTLAEMTGHLADELLINFNDLTLRTENEIRRESTKSAAVNAGSPAIAAAPVIAAAQTLANGTRKASRQITR